MMRSMHTLRRNPAIRDYICVLILAICCGSHFISNAFVPSARTITRFVVGSVPAPKIRPLESSSTALFGVRSTIRRKISSVKDVLKRNKNNKDTEAAAPMPLPEPTLMDVLGEQDTAAEVAAQLPPIVTQTTTEETFEPSNSTEPVPTPATLVKKSPQLHLEVIPAASETLTRAKTAASASNENLYQLPTRTRDLSKLEEEFRSMLKRFANYSEADILSISDPRKRALFEGIAASANSQPVYRAFEVLFEDLYPLRVAGRVIYTKLQQFMNESIAQRQQDVEQVVARTGLTEEDIREIEEIRLMFVSTASQLNGDSYLTLEQLAETGIVSETATEVLGFDSSQKLLQQLDLNSDGRLTFVELLMGLWEVAETLCGIENCNPHVVLHNLLVELNENPPAEPATLNGRTDEQRRRFSARYDEMVSSFVEWEDLLPPKEEHESRRMDVVRGCFVGAENQKVVDALRIVYVDYAALRVAGDIIFKLVSTIVNRI